MIGVLVSGEGTNLQALIDAELPVVAVASNRRGPALDRARRASIPTATFSLDCHATREERDLVMATWLEEHGVELVVLAGYMHLFTPPFLDRFPDRIVNVHPSLLPRSPARIRSTTRSPPGVETRRHRPLRRRRVDSGQVIAPGESPSSRGDAGRAIHEVEHRLLPHAVRELIACAR